MGQPSIDREVSTPVEWPLKAEVPIPKVGHSTEGSEELNLLRHATMTVKAMLISAESGEIGRISLQRVLTRTVIICRYS